MSNVTEPSDLTSDDIVLSHFTLARHQDITERVDAAAGAACAGIGIYIGDYQQLEDQGTADGLRDLLEDRGLCLAEIDALREWGHPGAAPTLDGSDREAAALRIADRFGCRSLHLLGPHTGTIGDAAAAFGALCDRAGDHGLRVGLEFMPGTNVANAADALRIVEAADRHNGGLCIDAWHHHRGANDLDLIRAVPAEKVIDVQISDGPLVPLLADYGEDTRRNRMPPGEGEMDLVGFVTAVRATGANAPWSLEVCNESVWDTDGRDFVARCAQGLRRVLAEGAATGR